MFSSWLAARTQARRDGIEVVAMDGFPGFKTVSQEQLPGAVEVMDPFLVVQLAGDALDRCRQRVQQDILGHRGRTKDPLYGIRRVLMTGEELLNERQRARLERVFADPAHADVKRMWRVYQQVVASYREPFSGNRRRRLRALIDVIKERIPAPIVELRKLGQTLHRHRDDILAYFDYPRTSNGPTEAVNGRLEHLRGSALGFRNLANYIARSLLESGGFRPLLRSQMR